MWTLEQRTVIKPSLSRPGRCAVTACAYAAAGASVAAGLGDGGIQLWDVRGKFGRSAAVDVVGVPKAQMVARQTWTFATTPSRVLRGAHARDAEVTSLAFSRDSTLLLSRGTDDALKLWDLRASQTPLAAWDRLPTTFSNTQVGRLGFRGLVR